MGKSTISTGPLEKSTMRFENGYINYFDWTIFYVAKCELKPEGMSWSENRDLLLFSHWP